MGGVVKGVEGRQVKGVQSKEWRVEGVQSKGAYSGWRRWKAEGGGVLWKVYRGRDGGWKVHNSYLLDDQGIQGARVHMKGGRWRIKGWRVEVEGGRVEMKGGGYV